MPTTPGARPGGDPPTKTSEADGAERFLPAAACTFVSKVIPGAKSATQAINNAAVAGLVPLDPSFMSEVREIYREMVAPVVHHRW